MPVKLLFFLLLCCVAAPSSADSPLRDHYSAYLAMHADDAVQWQLWDKELLARAEHEQKLIFISSGYFSCHWCHVMQRESFNHEVIASLLNSGFITVKLDRELNPELDAHLIEFVEKTRGVAGWPLNVFLTPQGHPLIGSGYLPADEFLALIKRLQVRWENEGSGLARLAAEAAEKLEHELPVAPTLSRHEMVSALQQSLLETLFFQADLLAGGVGDGAKFSRVPLLQSLMSLPAEGELDEFLQLTLMQMADNGLRDHIGGGFFRYTVDPAWQQPHFEKMLYDNAQLATLFLAAAQRYHSDKWRRVGMDTLDAVLRDFSHSGGGYVTSLSALDARGEEGGYYLLNRQEVDDLLSLAERRVFDLAWRLQGSDGWPGELPLSVMDATTLAETLHLPLAEAEQWMANIRGTLLQQRDRRALPRDEKRLAGWNGLMLSALARGVEAAGTEGDAYRKAGEALQRYLQSLWDGEQLWRLRGADGAGLVAATLEDYAYVAQGLFDWSEAVNDSVSQRLAARLTGEAFYRFFRDGSWQAASDTSSLLPSQRLLKGGALPSAAVIVARLGRRFGAASPLIPRQVVSVLFADPQGLLQSPLDYPGYIAEIQQLERRASRLSLE
ncbi:MAG: DUF255 domain-containing protein [Pseudomonadota bacterium]